MTSPESSGDQSGWRDIHDEAPCPSCKSRAGVKAVYRPPYGKKGPHIKARCLVCNAPRELSLRKYAKYFRDQEELQRYLDEHGRSTPKTAKIYKIKRPDVIFSEFGWCCIRCEGDIFARRHRLKQINSLAAPGLPNPNPAGYDAFEASIVTSVAAMLSPERLTNLFDLVPDHFIPKWVQELDGIGFDEQERGRCEKGWIVPLHRRCNSRRNVNLENCDDLLLLYSRFIVPTLKGGAAERIEDMMLFVGVLRKIESYRAARGLLAPERRAK